MGKKFDKYKTVFLANPLLTGSAVMFIGSNMANFFAMLYQFLLGRLLGKADYGDLGAVLSLVGLLSSLYTFVGLVVVKYTSSSDQDQQQKLFSWINDKIIKASLIISLIILLLTQVIAHLLHVSLPIAVLVAPIFLLGLLTSIYRSFLQGLLKFHKVVIQSNIEFGGRLLFGLTFVILGFGVFGALFGVLLATICSLLIARYFLKNFRVLTSKTNFKVDSKIYKYSLAMLINTLAYTSFFSSDVLLVKHFFTSVDAGIYISSATIGRMILFGTVPITSVMFPIVSKHHAQGKSYKKTFVLSILLTLGVIFFFEAIFLVVPNLLIGLLYGSEFLSASAYLFPYGIFIAIFSLAYLFQNYYLSKEDTRIVAFTASGALIQIFGIFLFHQSLYQVITVSSVAALMLLVSLLIYFIKKR